jgi:antitoxin HigA-1
MRKLVRKLVKITRASPGRRTGKKAPRHPGDVIREDYLEPLGISQRALARAVGVHISHLTKVILGDIPMHAEVALRLGRVLGTSAEYWMGLRQAWELWRVRESKVAAAVGRLKPIGRGRMGSGARGAAGRRTR